MSYLRNHHTQCGTAHTLLVLLGRGWENVNRAELRNAGSNRHQGGHGHHNDPSIGATEKESRRTLVQSGVSRPSFGVMSCLK